MSTARPHRHLPLRVLVVGGGVAGLEACFALQALAGERVHVTLIAPNAYLMYRPVGAHDPLALDGRVRVPLAHLARAARADLRHDRVVTFDPGARRVHTARGYALGYDALVVATGARPESVVSGAASLREENWPGCRGESQRRSPSSSPRRRARPSTSTTSRSTRPSWRGGIVSPRTSRSSPHSPPRSRSWERARQACWPRRSAPTACASSSPRTSDPSAGATSISRRDRGGSPPKP
jgi:hypothetical protein